MSQINDCLSSVLSKLCIAERNAESLHKILPSSLILLEYNGPEAQQIINTLTESWLHCFTLENVEHRLLKDLLFVIKRRVLQVYDDIKELIKNENSAHVNQQLVTEKLSEIVNLLSAIEKILKFYSKFDQVSATLVPSTLSSVNAVLSTGFNHFKNSEEFYSNAVASILEVLSALFQRNNKILLLFSALLSEKICFKCENEDELLLFIETLDSVAFVAETVMTNFDLKIMATQWKLFFKLIQTHIEYIRSRFDVSRTINFLINQIILKVDNIINKTIIEAAEINKILKTCNFSLKLIINVCELFQDESKFCYQNIVKLLCYILGYSSPYLNLLNMPSNLIRDVETLLTSFSEPFLNIMIMDTQFIQEFCGVSKAIVTMEHSQKIGYFILTITILRKLLSYPDKNAIEFNWVRSEVNIVYVAFQLMQNDVELLLDLRLPGEQYGDSFSSEIHLYRSLMIWLSGFIVGTISEADFPLVESILLKNICQQKTWPALLASDVWCAISRYASAELCLRQVMFFMKQILSWPDEKKSQPEWIFFTCLASRLFSFLSHSHKEQIRQKYPLSAENFWVWSVLKIPVPEAHQKQAELIIRGVLIDFLFSENANKLSNLIAALDVAPAINFEASPCQGEHFLKLTHQLWNCLSNIDQFVDKAESTCGEKRWLNKLLSVLSNITVHIIGKLDNNQVLNVLLTLKNLCKKGNSLPKFCTLNILTAISDKIVKEQANKKRIIETIGNLFQLLLCDPNHTVRQVAHETFEYFSSVTRYCEVIPFVAGNDHDLRIRVSNYLNHIPEPLQQPVDEEELFKKLSAIKFVHKCSLPIDPVLIRVDSSAETFKDPHEMAPSKKIKLDCDSTVDVCIKAIETSVSTLLPLIVQDSQVSDEQKRRLSSILNSAQCALGVNFSS